MDILEEPLIQLMGVIFAVLMVMLFGLIFWEHSRQGACADECSPQMSEARHGHCYCFEPTRKQQVRR